MPPGCDVRDIPGNDDPPCAVCCKPVDNCVCPECTVCGEVGNPDCYRDADKTPPFRPGKQFHGLFLNKAQVKGREEARIEMLKQQIGDAQQYLDWLEDQPDNLRVDLTDNRDPFE